MQTDSTNSLNLRRRHCLRPLCLVLVLAFCGACLSPPTIVVDNLLEPIAAPTRWMPTAGDLASARLARAALITRRPPEIRKIDPDTAPPTVEAALADLERSKFSKDEKDAIPLAIDLRNATLDDPIAYRAASRKLRSRRGLDPRIKSRLDRTIDDDPIHLAKRRQFDGWHRLWARTFNTISEPLGSSLITGFVLAPYQLANSIVHYFADFSNNESLSFTDRQALTLRKDFLRAHPDTELTPTLEKKIAKSTLLLEKTLALRRVRTADRSLDSNYAPLARFQARAAIKILSAHPEENTGLRERAYGISSEAEKSIAQQSRYRIESLDTRLSPDSYDEVEHALASRLILTPYGERRVVKQIENYLAVTGDAGRGRVEFVRALEQHESGFDFNALKRLRVLAAVGPKGDTMARHAKTLVDDDWQNPHGAFERLERISVREELAWRLAGEWVRRTRYPNLPTPVAYLIDAPTIALTILLAPLRALISPWTGSPDFRRAPSLAAYRYLVRYPAGAEQQSVVNWLYDYEYALEHWGRALRLADLKSDFDPKERTKLVEKTAEERIAQVGHIDRRDSRASLLKGVAREFPDSAGGHEAGLQARVESEDASPQHIRITKSFLLENPGVAGRSGIGLNPILLNDDDSDGELHPEGVMLRGGRVLEILLVAEGSDKKGPSESRHRKISRERLSQIAASLDEAVQRNSLIDVGARQAPDPSRDVYLERAGLGLTEEVDRRPTAESNFVYQSVRERYGLVRGRDSVLPFDLVVRGSLADFTLGAFPRWRPPLATPDAFLYR